MEDPELEALRKQRMAQLQSNQGEQQKNEDQKKEMINGMLTQILDQDALGRLNTLKIANLEKAQMVESMIIQQAQMGRIGGKINDSQLVQLLESINMPRSTSKVNFDRRRANLDSDSDEDYGM